MQNEFDDMLRKGLVSTSSSWIERAVQQKSSRLTVGLAHSKVLTYDRLDRAVCWIPKQILN